MATVKLNVMELMQIVKYAASDVSVALSSKLMLIGMLGWQDLHQRYRRSSLGPFWITISMLVMISTIGLVFGQIFNSPMKEYLPFLAVGTIVWTYMSTLMSEGCICLIGADSIIKQLNLPFFVHIARMIWRNFIILGHNIVIVPLVFIAIGKPLSFVCLLSIPGLFLVSLNLAWIALILAVICARYRDFPQIIASILQVMFYLTPIIWMPKSVPKRADLYLLDSNPFYHLLEIVREPMLGVFPSMLSWNVSIILACVGWLVALVVLGSYRKRIAYWL